MEAWSAFGAFTVAAAVLTVTPGLDTMLVLRTGMIEGRGAALKAALGVQAGCLLWGCAVAVGLGTLLAAAPLLYDAVRWCGAIYLTGCGLRLLLRPRGIAGEAGAERAPGRTAFRRGLLTNMLNPKVGLFYLSFLPGFVPAGWPVAPSLVGLTLIHIALALIWFGALLSGAGSLRAVLSAPTGGARWLDRVTGFVFVGFGLRLAVEHG